MRRCEFSIQDSVMPIPHKLTRLASSFTSPLPAQQPTSTTLKREASQSMPRPAHNISSSHVQTSTSQTLRARSASARLHRESPPTTTRPSGWVSRMAHSQSSRAITALSCSKTTRRARCQSLARSSLRANSVEFLMAVPELKPVLRLH